MIHVGMIHVGSIVEIGNGAPCQVIGEGTVAVVTDMHGRKLSCSTENHQDLVIDRGEIIAADWAGYVPDSLEDLWCSLNPCDDEEYW